jgi:hypothetical protein
MRDVKCKAAADVVKALEGLEVLCVGGLAVEAVDPQVQWGTQPSDELDLLIRRKDLDDFMAAMEQGGYRLAKYEPQSGKCVPVGSGQVTSTILRMPVSPEHSYAPSSCINQPGEPDLWINFHTTTRHGRLMLVDLAEWFAGKKKVQVMAGPNFNLTVYRPPRWAVLLWQAAEVTCKAAEQSIARHDVDRLRALAGAQGGNWTGVLDKAKEYEKKYRERVRLPAAEKRFKAYQASLKIDDKDMDIAERQYGALYELSHALRAVKDTVDPGVWAELQSITSDQPRKLWAYPDVVGSHPVPPPRSTGGKLGIARDDFGIHEQIQYCTSHPNAKFDDLIGRLLIPAKTGRPTAPPHGPWARFTKADMASIGLP